MGWRNSGLVAQNDGELLFSRLTLPNSESKHFIMPDLKYLILLGGDFTLFVSFFKTIPVANIVTAEVRLPATMKYSNKVNFTFSRERFCSWIRRTESMFSI